MTAPIWVTPKGTLGTIPEQVFYQLEMNAINPDDPDGEDTLAFTIVAGALPPGLVMYETGDITGQPRELYFLRGVPFDVKEDVTSTFCCRVRNKATDEVTDRTFSLTVTGEDPPDIVTSPGEIGRFLDGTYVEIQLEAVDLDSEPISWRISKGSLPPGLSLDSTTGLISGYVEPTPMSALVGTVGWSSEAAWDETPWDNVSRSISVSYPFGVQATDGKAYDGANYSIFVYSHDSLLADNDLISADDLGIVTADLEKKRNPVLVTKAADLGVYAHDNYFAYRFEARDFDGDSVSFSLLASEDVGFDNELNGFDSTLLDAGDFALPPGLTLNTTTGWLYGQIPRQSLGQVEYTFAVRVYKTDDITYISKLTYFTVTIVNDLRKLVTWDSSADLGTINSGDISEKFISASNELGRALLFTITEGRLPQGLKLNPDGLIVGRSSFELTTFDKNIVTFDKDVRELGFITAETTLDRARSFTVRAADSNDEIEAYKTFTLTISPGAYGPYESLYLKAQPGFSDKQVIAAIFKNNDVIPGQSLYRNSDPYFGRSIDIRMFLLSGINASSGSEYMQAMATNHYRKNLRLGTYQWAQALNADGTVAYEAVYIPVVDDLSQGGVKTVPKLIDLSSQINRKTTVDNTYLSVSSTLNSMDGKSDLVVYPNSLINMRQSIRDALTLSVKEPLPRWMDSKQPDGRILGWIPAVVVAYVKPGEGARVVFNLNRLDDIDIKTVSFDADRYIWDMNLSKNFNTTTNTYDESREVTFDSDKRLQGETDFIVDFAVDVPFSDIDGKTSAQIDDDGGLDGIISVYVGKKIVFAKQEDYVGFTGEYDGWVRYGEQWDQGGWDDPTVGFDDYEVIPGYYSIDGSTNDSTENQRSGVWEITSGDSGELRLVLDNVVQVGDFVRATNGFKYGGFVLRYGPNILYSQNEEVPNYHKFEETDEGISTTFDNQSTRFISSISIYQDPDEGDKYLAFPRTNIWA